MIVQPSALEACLVRIYDRDGDVVGAGFLVGEKHVVTCAHVVRNALGLKHHEARAPQGAVRVDFPLLKNKSQMDAVVRFWPKDCTGAADVAGLELCSAAPPEARAGTIRPAQEPWGKTFRCIGFPAGMSGGASVQGTILGPHASGLVQIQASGTTGFTVQPGFSGTPVWCPEHRCVIGMIATAAEEERLRTAWMIPSQALLTACNVIPAVKRRPIKRKAAKLGPLSRVPELPANFVPRPEYLDRLKQKLIGGDGGKVGVVGSGKVGVQGMGGIGKTVLAAAAAHDEDVRRAFRDGVIWLPFGTDFNLLARQAQLAEALGEPGRVFQDIEQGKAALQRLLAGKACLIVLDDVWETQHGAAFDVIGPRSRMLITSRHANVVDALKAELYRIDVLDHDQALALLAKWAKTDAARLPSEAHEVAEECGRLPLALAMIGAMVRKRPESWKRALQRLRDADLEKIKADFPDYPYHDLLRAMEVSVDALEDDVREKYLDFAIFPEDTPIPEAVLHTLWQADGLDAADVLDLLDSLADHSLIQRDREGRITLHDLQFDYVRKRAEQFSSGRHAALLEAYRGACPGGWHTSPDDGYFFQHIARHFVASGRKDELRTLLCDFRWLERKLQVLDANALMADYDLLPDDGALRLIQGAIRLSSHILANEKSQLASHLTGRLLSEDAPEIRTLLEQIKACAREPWLRPLKAALAPSGGAEVRTLEGHSDYVRAVAVTADGRCAVSGSDDETLKVWELATGREVRTLEGHSARVTAVAVTADGRFAVSGSDDRTLKVWELATGREVRTLESHSDWVTTVAVTAGRCAVSGSDDETLKVWELATGRE
ncbi:MAG TPA: NB-ARC domain-containing protein, partial [Planctomycetota bacterium]|nr:NB-ARC domain-containing protein [Planctomycetota bacterium]